MNAFRPARRNGFILLGLIAAPCLLATGCGPQGANPPGPIIVVETEYPGANAQTVAETLAGPIEQQVNGVEHLLSLSSQSSTEGTYTLRLVFQPGTDLDVAQREVQSRTEPALPVLPEEVRARGLTVRKKTPEPLLLISLTATDPSIDTHFLSGFGRFQIQNELARVPGVADISLFGEHDSRLQLAIDLDRLTAYGLTLTELVTALREQNIQAERGSPGEQGQLRLACNTIGKPVANSDALGDAVLRATDDGNVVRVRDVAQVEVARQAESFATLNSEPAVLLGIHALPGANLPEVGRAVRSTLDLLRKENTPDTIVLAVAVDLSLPRAELLIIDLDLPPGTAHEQIISVLERAEQIVKKSGSVQSVVATTRHPFTLLRNHPALIVNLGKSERSRTKIADELRTKLHSELPGCLVAVCMPAASRGSITYAFPIDFVIEDVNQQGDAALLANAEALVQKMNQSGKFVDVKISSGPHLAPGLHYDIDRERCSIQGVNVADLLTTLQLQPPTADFGRQAVKNKTGELVPVESLVRIHRTAEPLVIDRYNLYPAARVTANLATSSQLSAAKKLCEQLAQDEFDQQSFRLEWVR